MSSPSGVEASAIRSGIVSTVGPGVEPVGPRRSRSPRRRPARRAPPRARARVTRRPAPASRIAADSPASPAPTTTTWSVGPTTVRVATGQPAGGAGRARRASRAITPPARSRRRRGRRGRSRAGSVDLRRRRAPPGTRRRARRSSVSTAASAPGRDDDLAQRLDARGVEARVAEQRADASPPGPGWRVSRAMATSTVRLPSRRSSPAGLPVCGRVAEDAEDVVAQLEGLAERQPVRRVRRRAARRRRRRARRRGAAGRSIVYFALLYRITRRARSTAPVVPLRADAPARACRGTARHELGAHLVEDRRGRAPVAAGSRPLAVNSSSLQTRHRSPSEDGARRGRTARRRRSRPAPRCRVANRRWTAGMPAPGVGVVHDVVVDERARPGRTPARPPRVTICSQSGAAGAAPAPVAEGRAQPLAAARAGRRPRRPRARSRGSLRRARRACRARKSSRTLCTRTRRSSASSGFTAAPSSRCVAVGDGSSGSVPAESGHRSSSVGAAAPVRYDGSAWRVASGACGTCTYSAWHGGLRPSDRAHSPPAGGRSRSSSSPRRTMPARRRSGRRSAGSSRSPRRSCR